MSSKNNSSPSQTPEQLQSIVLEFRDGGSGNSIDLNEQNPRENIEKLLSFLQEFLWAHIFSLPNNSTEFQIAIQKISENITASKDFDIRKAKSANINQGMLVITQHNGGQVFFNLVDLWKESFMEPQKAKLVQSTREKERSLQDIVAKEAFYGGSVIMEYSLGTATIATGAILLSKVGFDVARTTQYVAKSMIIVDDTGVQKRIHFKNPFMGTSVDFNDSISRILNNVGFEYDPVTKKITSPAKKMLQALGKDLIHLKYEDYKKTSDGAKMTEDQFNQFKQEALKKQKSLLYGLSRGSITSKQVATFTRSVIKESLLFFPFVAMEYHNNQSAHNLLNAATNEAAFYVGAKAGAKIGKGIYKLGGFVLWGLGGVSAWQLWLNFLDARRQVWLHTQKMNYRHERSGFLHGTSLFLTEITAGVNWVARKISGNENYTWVDIGADRTHVMDPITGTKIFTVPEFTFYQDKVNMATRPWEWINASANRDVMDWNRYVDRYKIEATKNIYDLLGKYHKNSWIFWDNIEISKVGGKVALLRRELEELLAGDNTGSVFRNEMLNMINAIAIETSKQKPIPIPNSLINEYIHVGIGAMKIDPVLFVKDREEELGVAKAEIDELMNGIPKLTIEQKNFLQKIPDRMLANEQLFQSNEEKLIYEYLLKRTDIMNFRWQKISVGNFMAFWLDQVVDWKHEAYFVQGIKSGDRGTTTWTSF